MRLIKRLFSILSSRLKKGLFIKIRHAFPDPLQMLKAIRQPQSPDLNVRLDDRVVVIGLGAAAITFLQQLKQEGFLNVTLISRDQLYGGKCVNYGCMPSEFVLAHTTSPTSEIGQKLEQFIGDLRADVQKQCDDLNYPIIVASVDSISGDSVMLSNFETIKFDRLIIAMGGEYRLPMQLSFNLSKLIGIEDFWSIPPGNKVVIYAKDNIAAISLGDIAQSLGMLPTILLEGMNPIGGLPSFRYFVREIIKRGVAIHERMRLIRVSENEIEFDNNGKLTTLTYDYLIVLSKPVPNLPTIDGVRPTIYDLDLTSASLPERPDIVFLGDSAGFFTAAAAENQAKLLMRYWKYGERLDLRALDTMPVSLHGIQSFAMVGPEWSIVVKQWVEVDFRSLGWSKVHELEGKLWYLLDESSGKIEALHICHKHAGELIGLGAAMMAFPVWDVRWLTNSNHPSSAEIFKVVADKALLTLGLASQKNSIFGMQQVAFKFQLPDINELHPNLGMPDWLTIEKFNKAITSSRPRDYFLVYYGLSKLHLLGEFDADCNITETKDGSILIKHPDNLEISIDHEKNSCHISSNSNYIYIN